MKSERQDLMYTKNEFFHALIQNSSDLITIVSINGTILYESPSVDRVLGYDENELIGKNAFKMIHPEDIQKVRNAFSKVVIHRDLTLSADFRFLHKDGSWRVLHAAGSNQLDNPLIAGIVVNSRDITERKQIEEKLRQSEERFRKVFYTSPDAINMTRLSDGMSISVNEGFTRMLGYAENEVIGRTTLDLNLFVNPEDRKKLVDGMQKNGEVKNFEFAFRRKNGTIGKGVMSASALEIDGVQYLIGVTRNVTERKQTEEKLRQSEERFRRIFEDSPLGIIIVTPNMKIFQANKSFCEMLRYSEEELVGRSMQELTHPDDREKSAKESERVFAGQIPAVRFETRYIKKNQKSLWVQLHATTICDQDGKALYALGMIEDISRRKVAEREREQLISQLKDALSKIKTLRGLIPICAWCKKIRDDAGYWTRVETYIKDHSNASFTHCICPTCLKKEDPTSYREMFGDDEKEEVSKLKREHRASERLRLRKPVNCAFKVDFGKSEKMVISAILEEIGDTGMCVKIDQPMEVGSLLFSSIGAEDDKVGVVRWSKSAAIEEGGYRVGIQFVRG